MKIKNRQSQIGPRLHWQSAIRKVLWAISPSIDGPQRLVRSFPVFSLSFLVCGLLLFNGGCLPEKSAGPPSLLAKRLRPKPISPGPNGLFMTVIFLERPFGDAELNRELWESADDEDFEIAERQKLSQQGFRVAILGGQLPNALKSLFDDEELGQMNGEHMQIQAGCPTQIQTSGLYPTWSEEPGDSENGKTSTYQSAVGLLRATPRITSDGCIQLGVLPEIQHGDSRRQFVPDDGAEGKLNWTIQVGRQSRIFEELAFSHRFRPGQYLMVSCLPTRKDSLGARFFTRMKDGETIQRVLLIQATPSRDALAARAN